MYMSLLQGALFEFPVSIWELIEDRHGRKSTIIASQLPVKNWYDILAKNPTIADAILDRVVKSAYRIELTGVSMRK